MREAYWSSPKSQATTRGVFGDVRALAATSSLMNPIATVAWRLLGIDGPATRYRSEPAHKVARARPWLESPAGAQGSWAVAAIPCAPGRACSRRTPVVRWRAPASMGWGDRRAIAPPVGMRHNRGVGE